MHDVANKEKIFTWKQFHSSEHRDSNRKASRTTYVRDGEWVG